MIIEDRSRLISDPACSSHRGALTSAALTFNFNRVIGLTRVRAVRATSSSSLAAISTGTTLRRAVIHIDRSGNSLGH